MTSHGQTYSGKLQEQLRQEKYARKNAQLVRSQLSTGVNNAVLPSVNNVVLHPVNSVVLHPVNNVVLPTVNNVVLHPVNNVVNKVV